MIIGTEIIGGEAAVEAGGAMTGTVTGKRIIAVGAEAAA